MNLREHVSLREFSTMRLGGLARYLVEITSRKELVEAVNWADEHDLAVIMIGGGSNIVWQDSGFAGLVIVNKVQFYEDYSKDGLTHYVTVGAGENWDSVVARTVQAGLSGIECLSLIPGSAGGTPVQNVGAYGQEIADTLVSVEVYDVETSSFITMPAEECAFGYRTSRFKTVDKGRFFISTFMLRLTAGNPEPPFYAGLQQYLDENTIVNPSLQQIRDAVIAIRSAKLPDPSVVANNGSFFANPVVDNVTFARMSTHTAQTVPHWNIGENQVKIPAAWLIEQAGFKDFHDPETGMGTWPTQPLVLINESAQSTADLILFRQKILDTVQAKFGVTLQQEPELLP